MAAHGIDGHQGAFKLFGLGKVIEKIGDGSDLVGLLRHAQLRQDQPSVAGISGECMEGFEPFAVVVCPARGFAVNGDEIMPSRPEFRHPVRKAAPKQQRIKPVDEAAQPALARNAEMEFGKLP